jgi:hypothetical protein
VDFVDRDLVYRANNNLIFLAQEIWCFGVVADGVLAEIKLAKEQGKKVKFFSVGKRFSDIKQLSLIDIIFEDEVLKLHNLDNLKGELKEFFK